MIRGLGVRVIRGIAADPNVPGRVYVAPADWGVVSSTDGGVSMTRNAPGASWSTISDVVYRGTGGFVRTLSVAPDAAVWAGLFSDGVTMRPAPSYDLMVITAGAGRGSVTSTPPGVVCPSTCSVPFGWGVPVALTASPDAASTFTGWSGAGCSGTGTCQITMTQAASVVSIDGRARGATLMSDRNTNIIEEFRTNEGRVGGLFEGAPLLLLHSTGRRSGTERVNPLMYLPDGDRWIVFASKGGYLAHPHWIHNLEADPSATIEVGTETIPVKATVLREGPERDELFARQVALYPQFGGYAEKTKGHRTIPVIVLERAG